MDFKEQMEQMSSIMERTPSQVPSQAAGGQADSYKIPRAVPAARTAGGQRLSAASSSAKDKRPRYNNLLLCFDYNSTKGVDCARPTTGWGCRELKGQEYAHRCNLKLQGGAQEEGPLAHFVIVQAPAISMQRSAPCLGM
jgi:hypothetical protein